MTESRDKLREAIENGNLATVKQMNPDKYEGSCLCGQIKIQVTGPPVTTGIAIAKPAGHGTRHRSTPMRPGPTRPYASRTEKNCSKIIGVDEAIDTGVGIADPA